MKSFWWLKYQEESFKIPENLLDFDLNSQLTLLSMCEYENCEKLFSHVKSFMQFSSCDTFFPLSKSFSELA